MEALSAYSTPAQSGTDGGNLIFDRNAFSYGNAVSHDTNSSVFTIQEPGVYEVSFHGTIAPASGVNFPLQLLLYLQQQGDAVAGTAVRQTFQTTSDVSNASFSQIIDVPTAPVNLNVTGNGGNYIYSDVTMTISKIGNTAGTQTAS